MRPELPSLILSMLADQKMGVIASPAGADGDLCQTAAITAVRTAVNEILAGRYYLSPKLVAAVAHQKPKLAPIGAYLEGHPRDAQALHIAGGDRILVVSRRGK